MGHSVTFLGPEFLVLEIQMVGPDGPWGSFLLRPSEEERRGLDIVNGEDVEK